MTESAADKTTPRRILVADDNDDAATSLALLLKIKGHITRVVHDGLEAVAAAVDFAPDIILLDIGMPRLNGFDACTRIRTQPAGRQPIIVALTGWPQDEKRERSLRAGFDHYLIKPVEPDALDKVLTQCVRRGS